MGRGRDLALLRQSNAAGLHVKWAKDRANAEREAIEQELEDENITLGTTQLVDEASLIPKYCRVRFPGTRLASADGQAGQGSYLISRRCAGSSPALRTWRSFTCI